MELLNIYLASTSSRDKVIKLLSYSAKLLTVCTSSEDTERKLKIFSSKMSECRIIVRLLDDIPTLYSLMNYGWGKQEHDWLIRWCEIAQNVLGLFFCPLEHITWAGQQKFVSINLNKWDLIETLLWIISLQLSLVKSLRFLQKLHQHKIAIHNSDEEILEQVKKEKLDSLLSCIRYTMDTVYAVNYLPPNMLWGGRLKTWQVGAFGTISSCVGLYQSYSMFKEIVTARTESMKMQSFSFWNIRLPVFHSFSNMKENIFIFFESIDGRNKMLMITRDLSRILTICASPMYVRTFGTITNQMADCISLIKFWDFLTMWYPLRFEFQEETHTFNKYSQLIIDMAAICNHLLNPVIWAARNSIIAINVDKWISIDTCFALTISSMNMLKLFNSMKVHREMWRDSIKKPEEETWCNYLDENDMRNVPQFEEFQEDILKKRNIEMKNSLLTFISYSTQTIYFIHYLPKGVLWGGRLSAWQLGALGLVTSLLYHNARK